MEHAGQELRRRGGGNRFRKSRCDAVGSPLAGVKPASVVQVLQRNAVPIPAPHQGKATKHIDLSPRAGRRNSRDHILGTRDLVDKDSRILQVHQHHIHRQAGQPVQSDLDCRGHLDRTVILVA